MLFPKDKVLQQVIAVTELPQWQSTNNVFHDVMSCIIEQQIHYRSSKYVFQHVMREAGLEELTVANFPVLEQALYKLRLSEAKYEAMAHAVAFFSDNNIDWERLADDEVRERLGAIEGVGQWTVDMILLYTLWRPDVFPNGDYHLTRIMSSLYHLDANKPSLKKMRALAENWEGNRSLAVLYLLAYKNNLLKKPKQRG